MSGFTEYQFVEMSLPTRDVDAQEEFWTRLFDAQTIFRGRMMGLRFTRMMVCGISLIFREDPDFVPPPGPGEEWLFRSHLGIRVHDMDKAIADLEAKGAQFVLTPARVRETSPRANRLAIAPSMALRTCRPTSSMVKPRAAPRGVSSSTISDLP